MPQGYLQGEEAREGIWEPGREEGSTPDKVLQKQNPFVVASACRQGWVLRGQECFE